VSSEEALVPGFDGYLIPVVLNSSDPMWITGLHHKAIRDYGAMMNWRDMAAEGYVIVNPSSTAAIVTGALPIADGKDLIAYARMADKLFRMPVFYVEYSGVFGNMEWLRAVARVLEEAHLFYGGGIDGADKAHQALEAGAHTIVVGNILYEDLEAALSTVTVAKTQFIG
jgi:putative glycerol-1-phosphate prenyltransferase